MSSPNRNNSHELNLQKSTASSAGALSVAGSYASSVRSLERQQHQEQNPSMRSIAIATAPDRLIHFEPALKRESPGRIEPLSSFGRAASDQSAEFSLKEPCYAADRFTAPPSLWCAPSPDRRWHVDQSVLTARPNDYPVERTSRVVGGVEADVVSSRLSRCLQSRSIEADFSKVEAHVAKCCNTSYVKFYVRLYSAEGGSAVLVELQRICGDPVSFMHDCRALLDAAEGTEGKPPARSPGGKSSLYFSLPVSEMSFFKTASLPPVDEAQPVNMTAGLLSSPQSDSNLLGMESLAALTDVTKTCKGTAVLSAKRVLCPEHQDNETFSIHNYVMSLIIYGNDLEENSFYEGTAMEHHTMKLRNLAICSVANSLSLMASEGHLFDALNSCHDWYKDVFVPKLVQDLTTAKEHPHDACYASRCLSSLAMTCDRLVDKIKVVGGLSALKAAQEVGQHEFALLEMDAKSCHEMIQRRYVC